MRLYIDRGNTALKWQLCHEGLLVESGAASNTATLSEALDSLQRKNLSAINVSSVGSNDFVNQLREWAVEYGQAEPIFIKSSREAGGVTNAYAEPGQLGVDRWLAMIAAHNKFKGLLCVVDSGTALTMDFVCKEGKHLGGFIVPGFELMKNSLLTNTKKVEVESSWQAGALGQNTTEAVMLGIMQMMQSFVKQKVAEIESKYKEDVIVILTGGQAQSLSRNLPLTVILEKELVIEGLRVLEKELE